MNVKAKASEYTITFVLLVVLTR